MSQTTLAFIYFSFCSNWCCKKMLFWPTAKECRRSCNCYTRNTKPKKNITTSNWIERVACTFHLCCCRFGCVCVFVHVFISQWDFLSGSFLVRSFQFSCIKFRVFFFRYKENGRKWTKIQTVYEMLYNWNSKYWNVHWFPCASIAGQEPIGWKKTQIEVKCWS